MRQTTIGSMWKRQNLETEQVLRSGESDRLQVQLNRSKGTGRSRPAVGRRDAGGTIGAGVG